MSFNARNFVRALLPAAVIALSYASFVILRSGASPYAGLRVLLLVAVLSLAITVAAATLVRDRDRGALLGLLVILALIAREDPRLLLALAAAALVVRPIRCRWKCVPNAPRLLRSAG